MLHVALALDRRSSLVVKFEPDEPCQRLSLGESLAKTFAMLISAASDISGDAVV
jgi:hypothetical protein